MEVFEDVWFAVFVEAVGFGGGFLDPGWVWFDLFVGEVVAGDGDLGAVAHGFVEGGEDVFEGVFAGPGGVVDVGGVDDGGEAGEDVFVGAGFEGGGGAGGVVGEDAAAWGGGPGLVEVVGFKDAYSPKLYC